MTHLSDPYLRPPLAASLHTLGRKQLLARKCYHKHNVLPASLTPSRLVARYSLFRQAALLISPPLFFFSRSALSCAIRSARDIFFSATTATSSAGFCSVTTATSSFHRFAVAFCCKR